MKTSTISLRFILPLLTLPLLLTACPNTQVPKPFTVTVPTDPSVLQGRYSAELNETYRVDEAQTNGNRLYAVQSQQGGRFWVTHDLQDGRELSRVELKNGTLPKVLPDGQIVAVQDVYTLNILNAQTLAPTTQVRFATPLARLSLDGTVALLEDGTRADTLTGHTILTATGVGLEASASSDDSWRISKAGQFIRTADGYQLDSASQHGNPCRIYSGFEPFPVESLPDGGVALGYPDGYLELRGPNGSLTASIQVASDCLPLQTLRRNGFELAALAYDIPNRSGVFSAISLSRRSITSRTTTSLNLPLLISSEGVVLSETSGLKLTRPDGQSWTAPTLKKSLKLDVKANYLNEQSYIVKGSAQVEGEAFSAEGKASGQNGITFKAQYQLPVSPSVNWSLQLTRPVGAVLSLSGSNDGKQAHQSAHLIVDSREYAGTLTHP